MRDIFSYIFGSIIYSGPLIPFIITRFIKLIKEDKVTTRVFIIQAIVHVASYLIILIGLLKNNYHIEDLIFPFISGILNLIFSVIFIQIRHKELKKLVSS